MLAEPARVAGSWRQADRARLGAGAHGRGEQRPQVPQIGRKVADQSRSPGVQGAREVAPGQPAVDLDNGHACILHHRDLLLVVLLSVAVISVDMRLISATDDLALHDAVVGQFELEHLAFIQADVQVLHRTLRHS